MVIRQREHVAGVPDTARQGEMASGAQQPRVGVSNILFHRLFSVNNFQKQIDFFL